MRVLIPGEIFLCSFPRGKVSSSVASLYSNNEKNPSIENINNRSYDFYLRSKDPSSPVLPKTNGWKLLRDGNILYAFIEDNKYTMDICDVPCFHDSYLKDFVIPSCEFSIRYFSKGESHNIAYVKFYMEVQGDPEREILWRLML